MYNLVEYFLVNQLGSCYWIHYPDRNAYVWLILKIECLINQDTPLCRCKNPIKIQYCLKAVSSTDTQPTTVFKSNIQLYRLHYMQLHSVTHMLLLFLLRTKSYRPKQSLRSAHAQLFEHSCRGTIQITQQYEANHSFSIE